MEVKVNAFYEGHPVEAVIDIPLPAAEAVKKAEENHIALIKVGASMDDLLASHGRYMRAIDEAKREAGEERPKTIMEAVMLWRRYIESAYVHSLPVFSKRNAGRDHVKKLRQSAKHLRRVFPAPDANPYIATKLMDKAANFIEKEYLKEE